MFSIIAQFLFETEWGSHFYTFIYECLNENSNKLNDIKLCFFCSCAWFRFWTVFLATDYTFQYISLSIYLQMRPINMFNFMYLMSFMIYRSWLNAFARVIAHKYVNFTVVGPRCRLTAFLAKKVSENIRNTIPK